MVKPNETLVIRRFGPSGPAGWAPGVVVPSGPETGAGARARSNGLFAGATLVSKPGTSSHVIRDPLGVVDRTMRRIALVVAFLAFPLLARAEIEVRKGGS